MPQTKAEPESGLRRAVLICNSKARRGREWYPEVRKQLVADGFELLSTHNLSDPSKLSSMVKAAIKDETPLIIVGGGDGTMSGIAGLFKGSSSILGVLPLGTGNAFARDLGIPSTVGGACKILADGVPRAVDLGLANGKHFVNVVTVGLTTRIAEGLTNEAKKKLGRFVYAFAIARAMVALKPFRVTLTTPDGVRKLETMQVVFGSGRFHAGPFPIDPDAEITDHWLHGYALKGTSKGAFFKFALKLFGGHHVDLPEVERFKVKSARLATEPQKRYVMDGEIGPRKPIDLSIDPGALRVMTARKLPGSN